jgi:hypothetical protein
MRKSTVLSFPPQLKFPVKAHLHRQNLLAKAWATATRDSHATFTTVLALATLGGVTQIGLYKEILKREVSLYH